MSCERVNSLSEIAKNDNMVSINTSMAVDLTGQIASEGVGTRHYSGSGGQNDTAEGAIHAKNGRSIIALKSTAKNGTVSSISACLAPGSVVTLSRNNIDYIVTEYGIAKMKGMDVRERAQALIAIAHPDFREQLLAEAKKHQYL
jgi:acyl-CoA hydrolase